MVDFKCFYWLLTCTSLICVCSSQDCIVSVIHKMKQFEEELLDTKVGILRIEKKVLNTIDVAITSLKAELKESIQEQVREAMAEILQGESLQDMVKSQVVSDLQHLKQGYHQMKRQLRHVSRSLKDFQDEKDEFHESVLKKADVWNRENSSDTCVRDKHRLEIELQKFDVTAAELKADIKRYMALNETCQSQMLQMKTALGASSCTPAPVNLTTTSRPPVSTTSVMTPRPEEEKSRILIAPAWSNTQHHFRQLNIHSNSLSVYQYHTMKQVGYVAYIAKTKKLLIGLRIPPKIVSSPLDTSHVTVLREGVDTYGMAVDEDRDIVFIATDQPQKSISRMSTQGKDFTTIIDLSKYGSTPWQITLDTRRKRIYGCNTGTLFTVTYDGQGLATLATGRHMYAVTLDQTAGVLYYSIDKKLMNMTVSNNVSTEVTTLNASPWNMRLYRDTIYFSGWTTNTVGVVDVTYNTVASTLQSISMNGAHTLLLCLIP
ncbi:uncharacterized protein [Haliotis cracherodii]|uniref:uncharacterized protein n=1 Tax=Haliotis cracherodii TaxID=6455 RepID=UPI0039E8E9D5